MMMRSEWKRVSHIAKRRSKFISNVYKDKNETTKKNVCSRRSSTCQIYCCLTESKRLTSPKFARSVEIQGRKMARELDEKRNFCLKNVSADFKQCSNFAYV